MTRGDTEELHPVSYDEGERAYQASTIDARERFEELTLRDLMVRSLAKLQSRGEYDPQRHGAVDDYRPLTRAEHLEILALGTVLARYYRHPAFVHNAVRAGASWAEVATALGCGQDRAGRDYRTWAEGQHRLWLTDQGQFGLNDAEYTTAVTRAIAGRISPASQNARRIPGCAGCREHPVARPEAPTAGMHGRFCSDCIKFCDKDQNPGHWCPVCADEVGGPLFYLEVGGDG